MRIKNPPEDNSPYEDQIKKQFDEAVKCLKMLRPEDIDDKLQYYIGLNLALLELSRLALNQPKIWASVTKPIKYK